MNIGLDYDGTITADPNGWMEFIRLFQSRGHNVYIVTMRSPNTPIDPAFANAVHGEVYYTDMKAKRPFMENQGIFINVWIDDGPQFVVGDMEDIPVHSNPHLFFRFDSFGRPVTFTREGVITYMNQYCQQKGYNYGDDPDDLVTGFIFLKNAQVLYKVDNKFFDAYTGLPVD